MATVAAAQHFFVLKELVRRDFRGRYAGSLLGLLWSFVQPLWQLLLFSFVFSTVLRVSPLGERTSSFTVFLFSGLLCWLPIHEGVLRAATAITDNAALVKKLRFPAEILVLAVVLTALLHAAIAALVFLAVLVWLGEFAVRGLPLLLVAVPLQVGLAVGLGLMVAAFNVFVRDTSQVIGMLLSAWFYLTPIVYPLSLVPGAYRSWLELNPLATLVGLYREALLGGSGLVPGTGILVFEVAVLLLVGLALFRRLKSAFVEQI